MKIKCSKCEIEQHEDEFNFRDKVNGIKHSICKTCVKEYRKNYYSDNKPKAIEKSKESTILLRDRNRQFIWDYLKEHPCVDCGETDPVVLQFDHRDNKLINVSVAVQQAWSIERIKNEIDKCDVRCGNCHIRKTAKQFGWYDKIIK